MLYLVKLSKYYSSTFSDDSDRLLIGSILKKSPCCRQSIRDIQDLVDQTSFSLDMDEICEIPDHLLHSEWHHRQENSYYGSTEQVLAQSYPI